MKTLYYFSKMYNIFIIMDVLLLVLLQKFNRQIKKIHFNNNNNPIYSKDLKSWFIIYTNYCNTTRHRMEIFLMFSILDTFPSNSVWHIGFQQCSSKIKDYNILYESQYSEWICIHGWLTNNTILTVRVSHTDKKLYFLRIYT